MSDALRLRATALSENYQGSTIYSHCKTNPISLFLSNYFCAPMTARLRGVDQHQVVKAAGSGWVPDHQRCGHRAQGAVGIGGAGNRVPQSQPAGCCSLPLAADGLPRQERSPLDRPSCVSRRRVCCRGNPLLTSVKGGGMAFVGLPQFGADER